MTNTTSGFLSLNTRDWIKGLIVAIVSGIVATVGDSIQKGQFTFDFTTIWHTALAAGIAYMGKNLFTPAQAITAEPQK